MKRGKGKNKGNRFENLVARELSLWLTVGSSKYQLISTRMSGGWEGAEEWRQAGDLAPNGPAGERFRRLVMVECKHRKNDLLWALFNPPNEETNIQGWWMNLECEATQHELLPMLIFRQNQRAIMVALPQELAHLVAWDLYPVLYVEDREYMIGILKLDVLLAWPPEQFLALVEEIIHGSP